MIKTKDIAAQDLEVSSQIFLLAMIYQKKKYPLVQQLDLVRNATLSTID